MRLHMVFAGLVTIACSLALIPAAQGFGIVVAARIDQLVEKSERIVLVKVESVQTGLVRATVKDVWKGPKVETVEYRIAPKHVLDASGAVPGETILLFLSKEDGDWRIAWAGQGRMMLEMKDSKEYLSCGRVVFPDGTPSIVFSEGTKRRSDRGIELRLVKELIVGKK